MKTVDYYEGCTVANRLMRFLNLLSSVVLLNILVLVWYLGDYLQLPSVGQHMIIDSFLVLLLMALLFWCYSLEYFLSFSWAWFIWVSHFGHEMHCLPILFRISGFDPPPAWVFAWRVLELKEQGVSEDDAMAVADVIILFYNPFVYFYQTPLNRKINSGHHCTWVWSYWVV